MSAWRERLWYRPPPAPMALRPLAALYGAVADRRRRSQQAAAVRLPVPVIVVGNVAVGGTGKTPCVLWVVESLRALGRRPGILSRGHGGRGPFPCRVGATSDPNSCGDEPVLLARRAGVPLVCAPDRVAAAQFLLQADPQVDVLVCDDGLQHYRLARDLELCVVDGVRGFGNGARLPAGPLRERPERAAQCELILVNGGDAAPFGERALRFDLELGEAVSLADGRSRPLATFVGEPVYAAAGIGRPQRFFDALAERGLRPRTRAFPDHHRFRKADLSFAGGAPLLLTEKDAVKCRHLGVDNLWFVPAAARFTPTDGERVRQCLRRILAAKMT